MVTTTLSVNDVVSVTVSIEPLAAQLRNFGSLLLLGSSNVIDATQRQRIYTSITGVATDFGTAAPEYFGALEFFAQSPQPAQITIGRWVQSAQSAEIVGAPLTAAQQLLSSWQSITAGSFSFIYGSGLGTTPNQNCYNVTGLNFSGAANLTSVASIIQAAIVALALPATVTWNPAIGNFVYTDGSSYPYSGLSFATGSRATGYASITTNPTASDTITLNGTVVTFVSTSPTGNQVLIGGTAPITLTNLVAFVNASSDVNISQMKALAAYGLTRCNFYAVTPGSAGNSITLARSNSGSITLSGATLGGATGTDISGTTLATITNLGWSASSSGAYLVASQAAETLLQCVQVHASISNAWYCAILADQTVPQATDADHVAVSAYILAASPSRIYGVNTQEAGALVSTSTTDLASLLQAGAYMRTFIQYSSSSAYAICSFFGRMSTVDFTAQNSTLTAKFKLEPGVVAENLTETQAATLKAKNCNVFVNYQNGTAILQEGVMCNGFFFDEVFNSDWFQNALQTAIFNLLYLSPTKIPQTDAGVHQLVVTAMTVCSQAVLNGFIAPGTWTGNSFGQLRTGDNLPAGFYVYAPPVALQNLSDRAARKAPTLQIALKEAGAIHYSSTLVNVVR